MAIYTLYLRSFAPWKEFGDLTKERSLHVPVPPIGPMSPPYPSMRIKFGGSYHGDGRGFSLETTNPAVTARVNAVQEVDLTTYAVVRKRAWCDESRGPWMGFGPQDRGVGVVTSTMTAVKTGMSLTATISYGAPNPLVKGAPDIDARGEYTLTPGTGTLQIDAVITGDQFPACESFIEDPAGNKMFLGGFAPENKEQILRLYGTMNKPRKIWFQSHIVVSVSADGDFLMVQGGGSGSNASAPGCKGMQMSMIQWNTHIMKSIPMPKDAAL